MRRKTVSKLLALLLLVSLTGCGSSKYSDVAGGAFDGMVQIPSNASGAGMSKNEISFVQGTEAEDYAPEVPSEQPSYDGEDPSQVQGGVEIQKDMLVYRGSVSLTTKDYEKSIAGVQEMFNSYDCFIESSREYTDYRYYDDTDLMVYEATIRVNSKDYDSFMNSVGNIGVVTSKSSNVQNMNVEYSDTVTALRIQEARLERYLKRLEVETDSEVALQLEREITDIQIELQQLNARKNLIETDVAYSYITLVVKEVQAYSSQVSHTDPLPARVWAEVVNTYYEFTEFLTNLLFFVIHISPYVVIFVPIGIIVIRKCKGKVHIPRLKCKRKAKDSDADDKK